MDRPRRFINTKNNTVTASDHLHPAPDENSISTAIVPDKTPDVSNIDTCQSSKEGQDALNKSKLPGTQGESIARPKRFAFKKKSKPASTSDDVPVEVSGSSKPSTDEQGIQSKSKLPVMKGSSVACTFNVALNETPVDLNETTVDLNETSATGGGPSTSSQLTPNVTMMKPTPRVLTHPRVLSIKRSAIPTMRASPHGNGERTVRTELNETRGDGQGRSGPATPQQTPGITFMKETPSFNQGVRRLQVETAKPSAIPKLPSQANNPRKLGGHEQSRALLREIQMSKTAAESSQKSGSTLTDNAGSVSAQNNAKLPEAVPEVSSESGPEEKSIAQSSSPPAVSTCSSMSFDEVTKKNTLFNTTLRIFGESPSEVVAPKSGNPIKTQNVPARPGVSSSSGSNSSYSFSTTKSTESQETRTRSVSSRAYESWRRNRQNEESGSEEEVSDSEDNIRSMEPSVPPGIITKPSTVTIASLSSAEKDLEPAKFQCQFCKKSFKTNHGLLTHMAIMHKKERLEQMGAASNKRQDQENQNLIEPTGTTLELQNKEKENSPIEHQHSKDTAEQQQNTLENTSCDAMFRIVRYGWPPPPGRCRVVWKTKEQATRYMKDGFHSFKDIRDPVFCEDCGLGFQDSKLLEKHTTEIHPVVETIDESSLCNTVFATEAMAMKHMKDFHHLKDIQPIYCAGADSCSLGYFDAKVLKKHRIEYHPDSDDDEDEPDNHSAQETASKEHQQWRNVIEEIIISSDSEESDNDFDTSTQSCCEVRVIRYGCPCCNIVFGSKAAATSHLKGYHRITGIEPVYCDECGRGFLDSSILEKHMESHGVFGTVTEGPYSPDEQEYYSADNHSSCSDQSIFDQLEKSIAEANREKLDTSSSSDKSSVYSTPDVDHPIDSAKDGPSAETRTEENSGSLYSTPDAEHPPDAVKDVVTSETRDNQDSSSIYATPNSGSRYGYRDGNKWVVGPLSFPIVDFQDGRERGDHTYVASPFATPGAELEKSFKGERRKCSLCVKEVSKKYYKTHKSRHAAAVAGKVPRVDCPECPKKFAKDYLKKHIECIHRRKVNFTCHRCAKTFYRRYDHQRHISVEHERIRYVCVGCSKDYRYMDGLRNHDKTVHGTPVIEIVTNSPMPTPTNSGVTTSGVSRIPTARNLGLGLNTATSKTAPAVNKSAFDFQRPEVPKAKPVAQTKRAGNVTKSTTALSKTMPLNERSAKSNIPSRAQSKPGLAETTLNKTLTKNVTFCESVTVTPIPSRIPTRSRKLDETSNATMLEKTLNKSYVGERKTCPICHKEYASSYIKKHMAKIHKDGVSNQVLKGPEPALPSTAKNSAFGSTTTSTHNTRARQVKRFELFKTKS